MHPADVLIGIGAKPEQSIKQVREAVAKPGKSKVLLIEQDSSKIVVPACIGCGRRRADRKRRGRRTIS